MTLRPHHVASLLVALGAAQALAAEPILLPSSGPALEQLFAASHGAWTLPDAQIRPHGIVGHACATNGSCADFQLNPPSAACAGTVIAAGCLTVTPPTPGLTALLAGLSSPWQQTHDPPAAPPAPLWPWLLVWFFAPLALASIAAHLLNRLARPRLLTSVLGALAWLVLFALGSVLGAWWPLWDGLGMGLLAALAWLLQTLPTRPAPRGLLLSAVVLALGLAALEGAVALLAPHQAPVTPPDQFPFRREGDVLAKLRVAEPGFCALWGPPLGDVAECPPGPQPPTQHPAILHIGDSLLQAPGLPRSQTVTAWLERLMPGTQHINTGVGATSLDLQAVIAERWLARARFDALVFHVYPCNDLGEIDEPRLYCGDAPVLVLDRGTPRWRCPQPLAGQDRLTTLLRYSPPSFPLQWAAAEVRLARSGVRVFAWLARALRPATEMTTLTSAQSYRYALQLLLAESAAHGVPVAAVMMPARASACASGNVQDGRTLRGILRDAAVPVFDSQPLFDAATQTQGESAVFGEVPPGDPHLNPAGLERLGRWLAPQLQAWLAHPKPAR